ncbi:hypothetical protein chiPu_0032014 [Chiloscyllium punctatum]|uniref:Uncharacterized protein n=1 Tax=Chiloscyllium punctatum TaxID=137246 RepID=A0A401TYN7_CHIPU|nr:hypothetical protein [Chiloscyllium punctatum]
MGARTSTLCREISVVGTGQLQPCGENDPRRKMNKTTQERHGYYVNFKNKVGDALATPASPADSILKETVDSHYVDPFTGHRTDGPKRTDHEWSPAKLIKFTIEPRTSPGVTGIPHRTLSTCCSVSRYFATLPNAISPLVNTRQRV